VKFQLTKEQISQIISIVISAIIALLAVFGYDVGIMQPRLAALSAPAAGSQTLTKFDALQVSKLTVGSAATFRGGSTTAIAGDVTMAGYFTPTNLVATNATFALPVVLSSASITPTDGGSLTITADLVTLTPAGAVGTDLAACTTGKRAVLYNSIAANVVITDTGNGVLAGNQTLGQYDTLQLACFGSKWVQVGPVSAN